MVLIYFYYLNILSKLDGVATLMTDPPPASSTTLSQKKENLKVRNIYIYIHLVFHMTKYTWGGDNIISKFQVPSFYGLR